MKKLLISPLALALVFAVGALMLPVAPTEASGALNAVITCEPLGGGGSGAHICEAFPQESGLSYSWSRSGPIAMTVAGAVDFVTCTSQFADARVNVTITSVNGESSNDTQQIDCTPFGVIRL